MVWSNTPAGITVYVFIGIGFICVVSALIYTKVIRKNKFGYCDQGYFTRKAIYAQLKILQSTWLDSIIIKDVFLNVDMKQQTAFYYLTAVLLTNRCAFLITYSLNASCRSITCQGGIFRAATKRGRKLELPVEIKTVLEGRKVSQTYLGLPVIVIIPCASKHIMATVINDNANVVACNDATINATLKSVYDQQPNPDTPYDLKAIKKRVVNINYQRRMRLPFLNAFVKDTIWDKKAS